MTRLNRQLLRWRRYAVKTNWNPRLSRPAWMSLDTAMTPGHYAAWEAQQNERQRRLDRACLHCCVARAARPPIITLTAFGHRGLL